MTEEEAKALLGEIDLECTGEDDHDPSPCPKCARIRERIWKAVQKPRSVMPADVEMANECLSMIREKLARVIPMEHCPPMLYPEAIQNMFVWTARASRDCQVEHSWHHGDETLASKCIKGKVGEYAYKRHGA